MMSSSASVSTKGDHQASASTSTNLPDPSGEGFSPNATRPSQTAITQRERGSPGQNLPSPQSVPKKMPVDAKALTAAACSPASALSS